jgi:hypothetical protein
MKLWHFALVALLGFCAGAASDEAWHAVQNRNNAEVFGQRVRCSTLADAYAKKNSADDISLYVEHVDFSSTRRSCVAAITRALSNKQGDIAIYYYDTVDIVTAESLFSGSCIENNAEASTFCGNGRNMKLIQERDKALETALSK